MPGAGASSDAGSGPSTDHLRRRPNAALAVLASTVGVFSLLVGIVVPALPVLAEGLGTTRTDVAWLLSGYLAAAAVCTPVVGRLGDLLGKRLVLVGVLVVVVAGGVLASLSTSLGGVLAGRVVQGVGASVIPLAFGMVRDLLPARSLAGGVGVVAGLVALGSAVGQLLAGPVLDLLGTRALFWLPAALLAGCVLPVLRMVPESQRCTVARLSWFSAVVMAAWLLLLVLLLGRGPAWGWTSGPTLACLAGTVVGLALWVRVERRTADPLVDLVVLAAPAVWRANAITFLLGITVYAYSTFLPQYVLAPRSTGYGLGVSVSAAGRLALPVTLLLFVGGLLAGRLAAWHGLRWLLASGSAMCMVAAVALALGPLGLWPLVAASCVLGLGFGLVFPGAAALVVGTAPPDRSAVASAVTANVRLIGGAVGVAGVGSVLAWAADGAGNASWTGYRVAFTLFALTSGVAVVLALSSPRVARPVDEPAPEVPRPSS